MTYDLLFFGVFCLLIISYLVWDTANRKGGKRELQHPMYDLKEKSIEEISNEDRTN